MPNNETNFRCSVPGRSQESSNENSVTTSSVGLSLTTLPNPPRMPSFRTSSCRSHRDTMDMIDEALEIVNDHDSFLVPPSNHTSGKHRHASAVVGGESKTSRPFLMMHSSNLTPRQANELLLDNVDRLLAMLRRNYGNVFDDDDSDCESDIDE